MDGHRTRNGYRITVSSDVTELKRQKAELARRSRLLETTLNAADRGICIWGPDGRLTMCERHRPPACSTCRRSCWRQDGPSTSSRLS